MPRFLRSAAPLDVAALGAGLRDPRAGGFATFEGWVRDHHAGRAVDGLDYEAYGALAEREGERIVAEAMERFDVLAACCFHGISPKKVVLVGVQPESFETSMELTPKVAAVLDQVIDRLLTEIAEMGVTAAAKAA